MTKDELKKMREEVTNSYAGKRFGTMPVEQGLMLIDSLEQAYFKIDSLKNSLRDGMK